MNERFVSWRQLISREMRNVEDPGPLIACTLTEEELDVVFYDGFGVAEGKPFTAWTERRVYFPAMYDGSVWVASVPRNPCDEATEHVGGGYVYNRR